MKISKQILSLALALMMCLTLIPVTAFAAATFSDVPEGHWAYTAVEYLNTNNIMGGVAAGEFAPDGLLPRAQLAVMLCRVENVQNLTVTGELPTDTAPTIEQIEGYYANHINYVVNQGWMIKDNGDFHSGDEVTREELVYALYAVRELDDEDVNINVLNNFSDGGSVSLDCKEAMAYFVERGYIRGTADGTLSPTLSVNRAMTAVLLYNVLAESWTPENPNDSLSSFSDVPASHWAYNAIMYLSGNGILNGFADGFFGVEDTIDRAQMAVVLCRAYGVNNPSETPSSTISDISDHWAASNINHAVAVGWMAVDSDGDFNPTNLVTREEFMQAMIGLVPKYVYTAPDGSQPQVSDPLDQVLTDDQIDLALSEFGDGGGVGEDYKHAVAYMVSSGLAGGLSANEFGPAVDMTRGMVAAMLHRILLLEATNPPILVPDPKFREYIYENTNGDSDLITMNRVNQVTGVYVSNTGISDLTGIEQFTELTHLQATYNNLTKLNLGGLKKLTEVYVNDNELTSVIVSGCTALEKLNVSNNELPVLNISDCDNLIHLACSENLIVELDVSNKTKLKEIYAHGNAGLNLLNVSGCSALKMINVINTGLTGFDVNGLTALRFISATGSQIMSLDAITNKNNLTRVVLNFQFFERQWTATAGNGSVTLSWLAASPAPDYYRIEYMAYGGDLTIDDWNHPELGQPTVTAVDNIKSNTYTITGLTNGTTYSFVLFIVYDLGDGDVSAFPHDEILRVTPTAPSGGNDYGGGSGSGGSTNTPLTPEQGTTETTVPGGTDNTINIPATVNNETGAVSISLDTNTQDTLIADAVAKVSEQNTQPTVTLDLSNVTEAKSAIIDVDAAQTFSDAEVAVTLKLPSAEITLSPEALAGLAAASNVGTTPITVDAATVPMNDLSGMQAAQAEEYSSVISIDVFVGDTKIDAPITVSIPYTLGSSENPSAVCVWYMDDDGGLTNLKGTYDAETGMITFTVNHQSYFVVGYDPVALWSNVFSDVDESAWYYDAVAYANYHGLFVGDGGAFMPADKMTRAMFATVLWNLEGKPAPEDEKSFSDIPESSWYHDAVIWAAECEIVTGYAGVFDPDRPITRQEMGVMMHRYAQYKGHALPENRALPTFTDYSQIDAWAETAAKELAEAGVLSGDNNEFMPKADASRAEVAQMFKNFMRFVVGNN